MKTLWNILCETVKSCEILPYLLRPSFVHSVILNCPFLQHSGRSSHCSGNNFYSIILQPVMVMKVMMSLFFFVALFKNLKRFFFFNSFFILLLVLQVNTSLYIPRSQGGVQLSLWGAGNAKHHILARGLLWKTSACDLFCVLGVERELLIKRHHHVISCVRYCLNQWHLHREWSPQC